MRYYAVSLAAALCLLLLVGSWPVAQAENVTEAIKALQSGEEMEKNAKIILRIGHRRQKALSVPYERPQVRGCRQGLGEAAM
ncbi:MAG: hypothetical protein U5N86_07835 [Planctomycetota bacterium]|nr:hypothetical protein [Planctomycetota bacterium]